MAPPSTRSTLPRALRRDSLWTFALLGLSALLWTMGLPVQFLVVLTGPAAVAFAISALINSRGIEAASGIRAWLWIAIGMGAMIVLGGVVVIVLRQPTQELEACLNRAITHTARRDCQAQYERAVEDLLRRHPDYGAVREP